MKIIVRTAIALLLGLALYACHVSYSFSGTSIDYTKVKTLSVEYFENKALMVNPSLANLMTEQLIDKYKKLTSLDIIPEGGDLVVTGEIVGYDTRPTTVTAENVAAQNRLTITVKVSYYNKTAPEQGFEDKTFSGYADYDSMQALDAVEAGLCDEIVEKIIEDIFNATVANW